MTDIDKIVEKYFDGETSLEEEKILRRYFRQPEIEERHKVYAPMFNFFSGERKEIGTQKKKKKRPIYLWISIVASILLIVTGKSIYTNIQNEASLSMLYINGHKVTNLQTINSMALMSIENVSDVDQDIINSQIGILESFTE